MHFEFIYDEKLHMRARHKLALDGYPSFNEYDACHCKKYIKGEDEGKEMTLEEKNQE